MTRLELFAKYGPKSNELTEGEEPQMSPLHTLITNTTPRQHRAMIIGVLTFTIFVGILLFATIFSPRDYRASNSTNIQRRAGHRKASIRRLSDDTGYSQRAVNQALRSIGQ